MFFLGLAGLFVMEGNRRRLAEYLSAGSILLVAAFYSLGIYTTYYTYCGYDAYVGGVCTLPTYKNLEKEDAPEEEVTNNLEIHQSFTNLCGRLETVQVFVKSVPQAAEGDLLFTLLGENRTIVEQREIPFGEIVPEDYLQIPVRLPSDSRGGEFEIQLKTVNAPPQVAISFLLTRADYYPGQLTVDGVARRSDLLIHYSCAGP
jgi:hypothetical protein